MSNKQNDIKVENIFSNECADTPKFLFKNIFEDALTFQYENKMGKTVARSFAQRVVKGVI